MTDNKTVKVDTFYSREGALSATGADLARMVADVKRKITNAENGAANLRIAAAYTMHVYCADKAANVEGWKFSPSKVAAEFNNTATSNVYMWKRIGAAAVILGIEPGSDDWSILTKVANRAPMSWVLDGYKPEHIIAKDGKPALGKGDDVKPGVVTREAYDWAKAMLYPNGVRGEDGNIAKADSSADVDKRILTDLAHLPTPAESGEADTGADKAKRAAEYARYLLANIADLSDDAFAEVNNILAEVATVAKQRRDEQAANAA